MKKLFSLLLALVLLFSLSASAFADTEVTYFPPTFTNALEYNAKEWMESEASRAFFAVLISLDYMSGVDDAYDMNGMLQGTMYVGRDSFIVSVVYAEKGSSKVVVLAYDTQSTDQAGASVFEFNSSSVAKTFITTNVAEAFGNGYYLVDPVDLAETVSALKDMLDQNK